MLITEIVTEKTTDWISHRQLAALTLMYTDRATASEFNWMETDFVSQDDMQTQTLGLETALEIDRDNINAWFKSKQIPITVLNIKQTPNGYITLYKVQDQKPQIH